MTTATSTMPKAVADKVDQWLGVYDLLQVWEQDGTYFIVAKTDGTLYLLRLFSLGGEYVLSQDSMYTL